ncbi:hypothetical protein [Streptomyces sp. NPDC088789]|uniref:hypothetical protein n=1 Tax=Streptomyces sp. NPDC088789 TaxID=3365899 RepID=UPI0038265102
MHQRTPTRRLTAVLITALATTAAPAAAASPTPTRTPSTAQSVPSAASATTASAAETPAPPAPPDPFYTYDGGEPLSSFAPGEVLKTRTTAGSPRRTWRRRAP